MNLLRPVILAAGLAAAGCAVPLQPIAQLDEAALCFHSAHDASASRQPAYAAERERRGTACTPALVQAGRLAHVDRANERPPPHYYGGPP